MGHTITVRNPGGHRVAFDPNLSAVPAANAAPIFLSQPEIVARVGQPYSYPAAAHDPDGELIEYVLYQAPDGMMVNPSTGLVTWTPTAASPADAAVVLLAYDARGANTAQAFNVQTIGVNRAPVFQPLRLRFRCARRIPREMSLSSGPIACHPVPCSTPSDAFSPGYPISIRPAPMRTSNSR
jgi:hypothetical protein